MYKYCEIHNKVKHSKKVGFLIHVYTFTKCHSAIYVAQIKIKKNTLKTEDAMGPGFHLYVIIYQFYWGLGLTTYRFTTTPYTPNIFSSKATINGIH